MCNETRTRERFTDGLSSSARYSDGLPRSARFMTDYGCTRLAPVSCLQSEQQRCTLVAHATRWSGMRYRYARVAGGGGGMHEVTLCDKTLCAEPRHAIGPLTL